MEDAGMKTGRMEAAGGKDSAKERSRKTAESTGESEPFFNP